MSTTLATAVEAIAGALHDRDLQSARRLFDAELAAGTTVDVLVRKLAATVVIPKGMVVWGFGIDVWANPHRFDYAWRCGGCRTTASGYRSERAAKASATEHARKQHRGKQTVVSYLDEAYWNAIENGGAR